jgi:ribosomal protein L37AE/L43A
MAPWRYCCPECESHSLSNRVSGGYRCTVCGASLTLRYDKKREELTA